MGWCWLQPKQEAWGSPGKRHVAWAEHGEALYP